MTRIWCQVRNLEDARAFYAGKLGFTETYAADDGWVKFEHGDMQIALAEGVPDEEGPVASIDVFDPDGNRLQLVQPLIP